MVARPLRHCQQLRRHHRVAAPPLCHRRIVLRHSPPSAPPRVVPDAKLRPQLGVAQRELDQLLAGITWHAKAASPRPDLVEVVHEGRVVVRVPNAQLVRVVVPPCVHPPAPRDGHCVNAPKVRRHPGDRKRVRKHRRKHQIPPPASTTRSIAKLYLPPPPLRRTSWPCTCVCYLPLDLEGVAGPGTDVDCEGWILEGHGHVA